jgi:vacuolar protein sorting-associated protein 54
LLDYLKVILNLTMLTPDTMSKVIEFLKAFNSRTCQVVLGAGAMRSAGLKNITARHLGEFPYLLTPIPSLGRGV